VSGQGFAPPPTRNSRVVRGARYQQSTPFFTRASPVCVSGDFPGT